MRLYKRNARLTVYRARPATDGYLGALFDLIPNAVEITDLRMQFTIEKRLGGGPNTCTVIITNLAEYLRAELQTYPLYLYLDAGYDGEYRRIFTGDLRWGASIKRGVNWETTVQIGDGSRAYKSARVRRSFAAGTPVRTALREAARSMGLQLPRHLDVAPELDEQFAAGTVLEGPSRDELTRLLAPYGYEWTIQDGALQVYRDDQARPDQALVVSPDTGLIDSPEFAPPTYSAKPSKSVRRSTVRSPLLRFRTLLYPQIVPGCRVAVQSTTTDGIYKVVQVTHTGDTTPEGDWTTDVEAKPL